MSSSHSGSRRDERGLLLAEKRRLLEELADVYDAMLSLLSTDDLEATALRLRESEQQVEAIRAIDVRLREIPLDEHDGEDDFSDLADRLVRLNSRVTEELGVRRDGLSGELDQIRTTRKAVRQYRPFGDATGGHLRIDG